MVTPEREQYIRDWSQSNSEPLACHAMRELFEIIDKLRYELRKSVSNPEYDFVLKKQDESSRRSVARLRALERIEEYLKDRWPGHAETCDCGLCDHLRICRKAIDL